VRAIEDPGLFRTIVDNLCEGVLVVDRERKVLYWSPGAERITGHSSVDVVGRHSCDGVLANEAESGEALCPDRCPLARTLVDGVPREANVYLHHKDGHRVPVCVRPVAVGSEGGEISGALQSFVETFTRPEAVSGLAELEQMVSLDAVTGVANRHSTELRLRESMSEMHRYGRPFGVVVLDVDDLKRVKDTYGQQAGDRVLRMVARTLAASSRPSDVVGRWSGDELLVVIKNVDEGQLVRVADKFRSSVSTTALTLGQAQIHVTVSAGAAEAQPRDTADSLAARAENLLHLEKRGPGA
jgi:diguanylate cyclase (GGDEF)-like protein/PAS domain S-box-containing protein